MIFTSVGVFLLVCILLDTLAHSIIIRSQAPKDVGEGKDASFDTLQRIETFSRRLEVYTEITPTQQMIEMNVKILVEVFSILAIVTKEIKQGRMSRSSLHKYVAIYRGIFRKTSEEAGQKDRYRGCAEEIRPADARGGSNGCCGSLETNPCDR